MFKKPCATLATLACALSAAAQTGPFLIDIDSTVLSGADMTGTIATEAGWESLDATMGNASPGVTVDGITFTIGSADGSRVREDAGMANPNPITGDFVFDDGAGQAVIVFIGGAGSLPMGEWQVEMWVWDETAPLDDVIVAYRTNNMETIVEQNAIPDPADPVATFVIESDGTSAYDVFVRENNDQNRARLNAVRITRVGASGVDLDPPGVSATLAADQPVGTLVPVDDPLSASYAFALVTGAGDTHNSEFAIDGDELRTSSAWPGHAAGEMLSVRVRVADAEGGLFEGPLVIPVINDTDTDGLDDAWELMFFDDLTEATGLGNNDGDLLNNIDEFLRNTFPNDEDSDDDDLNDDVEDNDGTFNGPDDPGTDPRDADTDDDLVNDGQELIDGTNPLLADTDGDGLSDSEEKTAMTNPLLGDTDGDGHGDKAELDANTDPNDPSEPGLRGALAAYWPLDTTDGVTTPDAGPNGFHLDLNNMSAASFVNEAGRTAASFNGTDTMLTRISMPGEDLPINQHDAFTVSMWVKIKGTDQNDLRFFSEGSTTNGTPLFNMGTRNNGADDSFDLYMREVGPEPHQFSAGTPLDDTWRHLALTSNSFNSRIAFHVDGVLDRDDFLFVDIQTAMDTTSVGGILRDVASHWVTGFVDDVSLWKCVLQPADILDLANGASPLSLAGGDDFRITAFTLDETTGDMSIAWNAEPGVRYIVHFTDDLTDLKQDGDVGDGITDNSVADVDPAEGTITIEFRNPLPAATELFFTVHED